MSDRKKDELLGSAYDGIQEYDNDLPRWWVQLFILTVIIGIVYAAYVHVFGALTDHDKLQNAMQELEQTKVLYAKSQSKGADGPEKLLALVALADHVEKGRLSFIQKCAPCHGQKGEGVVGPNLTDEFWLHGSKIEDIHKTVNDGVPAKGMMAWKALMSTDEVNDVVAFLWSIRNTNVPGKAAQGEKS